MERHILRNCVFLHAIENDLDLPIGTQDAEMLDSRFTDEDVDEARGELFDPDDEQEEDTQADESLVSAWTMKAFEDRAANIYGEYSDHYKSRFRVDTSQPVQQVVEGRSQV